MNDNYQWIAGEVLTFKDRRKEKRDEVLACISITFLLAAILVLGIVLA